VAARRNFKAFAIISFYSSVFGKYLLLNAVVSIADMLEDKKQTITFPISGVSEFASQ
jgi:hypothetical protein